MSWNSFILRANRFIRWHRRSLAVVCSVAAIAAALHYLHPHPEPSSDVAIASHSLDAGTQISSGDIETISLPTRLLPEGVVTSDQLKGRVIASVITKGTILTEAMLVGSSLASQSREQLVPFRVSDADLISLLQVGDTISVLASQSDGSTTEIAHRVRVAALPDKSSTSSGGGVIVVAASPKEAEAIATAATHMRMAFVVL